MVRTSMRRMLTRALCTGLRALKSRSQPENGGSFNDVEEISSDVVYTQSSNCYASRIVYSISVVSGDS